MTTTSKEHPGLSREALALVALRFRVLGDATRLGIVQTLFGGEQSVQEICRRVGTSQANISRHLTVLVGEGLLGRRKEGLFVYYSIADASLHKLCELVCFSLSDRFERALDSFQASREGVAER
jgi:ArsR family transcriptional regulator